MSKFLMAVIQIDSQADKQANLDKVGKFIDEAAARGAQFVSMPENVHFCGSKEGTFASAEPVPGPMSEFFAAKAKQHKIWLHCGSIGEVIPNETKLYNTTLLYNPNGELAGKIAAISTDGKVVPAKADGEGAVGLFREDLKDMINASNNASFYFRGGEYHIAESRLGEAIDQFTLGKYATTDANGALVHTDDKSKAVATVISIGEFRLGNMFEWAGEAANGGKFLGIVLHI